MRDSVGNSETRIPERCSGSIKVVDKILEDFSIENRIKLFQGDKRGGISSWYLIGDGLDIKNRFFLTEKEIKYKIEYNRAIGFLSVNGFDDLLTDDDKEKVFNALSNLDEKVLKEYKNEKEQRKQNFIRDVLFS